MQKNTEDKNGNAPITTQGLISFMKRLRSHLGKQYKEDYYIGSIYYGDNTIVYFPFTPKKLKKQKLKIAIVYNYQKMRFEIWLAGQNKQIQKEYLYMFKGSDWAKYHIPASITDGFSIVESILFEEPNIDSFDQITEIIESKSLQFINDIEEVLK